MYDKITEDSDTNLWHVLNRQCMYITVTNDATIIVKVFLTLLRRSILTLLPQVVRFYQ